MSVSKRARKASSDLDQASVSPSEEDSESPSESEKTSDQVSKHQPPGQPGMAASTPDTPVSPPRILPQKRRQWPGRHGGVLWEDARRR